MRRVIVSYKVKPERLEEHVALVRAVFDELSKAAPAGIRYGAFQQADRVSFAHVAFIDRADNPLEAIAAFKAFTAKIQDRCAVPPSTVDLEAVATYGF
jgi:hypothetical protein